MKRIVIDTNVLVASAYNQNSASRQIVDACRSGDCRMIVSPAICKEYEAIVPRAVRIRGALENLRNLIGMAEVVEPAENSRVVPDDPDDDKFVAAAKEADADAIISSDDHLRSLDPSHGVTVQSPTEFVQSLSTDE